MILCLWRFGIKFHCSPAWGVIVSQWFVLLEFFQLISLWTSIDTTTLLLSFFNVISLSLTNPQNMCYYIEYLINFSYTVDLFKASLSMENRYQVSLLSCLGSHCVTYSMVCIAGMFPIDFSLDIH